MIVEHHNRIPRLASRPRAHLVRTPPHRLRQVFPRNHPVDLQNVLGVKTGYRQDRIFNHASRFNKSSTRFFDDARKRRIFRGAL